MSKKRALSPNKRAEIIKKILKSSRSDEEVDRRLANIGISGSDVGIGPDLLVLYGLDGRIFCYPIDFPHRYKEGGI
ncbi:MAG: hypothetical protein Q8P45_00015 [Candidatus Harrisonbacteria bacterium]|nr:hypothetical protein [Candidatus Harrisonbacteria bacterium]